MVAGTTAGPDFNRKIVTMANSGMGVKQTYYGSGITKMNGTQLFGDTNYPNNLSIISLVTTGNYAQQTVLGKTGFTSTWSAVEKLPNSSFIILPLRVPEVEKLKAILPTNGTNQWHDGPPIHTSQHSLLPGRHGVGAILYHTNKCNRSRPWNS